MAVNKNGYCHTNGRKEMRLVASLPLMVLWSGAAAYDAHLGSGMLYREAHEALLFPQLHLSHRVRKRQTVWKNDDRFDVSAGAVFWIQIRISDSDPDSGGLLDPDWNPDPDPEA